MKWMLIVVGGLIAIAIAVTLVGMALPQSHTAARSVPLAVPPERVWALITDAGAYPTWRTEVKSVEVLTPPGGALAWRETTSDGTVAYEAVESVAPNRFVARITDENLPYGGAWEYVIAPAAGGSRLTITERGEVYNLLFRFMARFVFGHTATLDGYLRAVGRKFGETVTPEAA